MLPEHKRELLRAITQDLKNTDGVEAVVLGGSWATGTASVRSDMDIGIYYHDNSPFHVEAIGEIARKYALEAPIVTGFYEWGPWVNGGAWITTGQGKVDFLYRSLDQVAATVGNALNGVWEEHFEQQPPYGFSSLIYLEEIRICQPQYDPGDILGRLKKQVALYPEKLRDAVINRSLWAAEFAIWHAGSFSGRHDVYNTAGCLTRAAKYLVSALLALNRYYPIGDKRVMERLEAAELKPRNFRERMEAVLCVCKENPSHSVAEVRLLHEETAALSDVAYKPLYRLAPDS